MHFKIKRGVAQLIIINLLFILLIFACYTILKRGAIIRYTMFAFIGVYAIYILSMIFCSCYIKNQKIYYRNGLLFYKIPIEQIRSMQVCKNMYFSLSPDTERIRIIYEVNGKEKMKYISVEDNENLISVIEHRVYERIK